MLRLDQAIKFHLYCEDDTTQVGRLATVRASCLRSAGFKPSELGLSVYGQRVLGTIGNGARGQDIHQAAWLAFIHVQGKAGFLASYVYLDESGDTGYRFDRGSSRYFVIVLLIVDDTEPVHASIDQLRRKLGFGPRGEFKFSHSTDNVRKRYLSTLCSQAITIRAFVFDKRRLTGARSSSQYLSYHELVDLVLRHNREVLEGATLTLDETVRHKRRRDGLASELKRALRAGAEGITVSKIVYRASHQDNLIQAADMVAGAIYRRYHRDDDEYYRIIEQRIDAIVEWPSNTEEV